MGSYIYTQREKQLFINLFIGSEAEVFYGENSAHITLETGYPWNGKVKLVMECESGREWDVALHLPDWCREFELYVDGESAQYMQSEGYLYLRQCWKGRHEISFNMKMEVREVRSNPKVRDNIGKVAVMRGPVVYCLEEEDNGADLHCVEIPSHAQFEETYRPDLLGGVVTIKSIGRKMMLEEESPLYLEDGWERYEEKELLWIPYYSWANREAGEMIVWVRKH